MAGKPGSLFNKFTLLALDIDYPMTGPEVGACHAIGAARYQENVGRDGTVQGQEWTESRAR